MENIETRVKKVIFEQLCPDSIDDVKSDSTFEHLGGDSLDQVEIVMALEDEFEIDILADDEDGIKTVQHAIDYITKRVAA